MKIAILEVECHAEVLRSTIHLFSEIPNYQLSIFTTPEILAETGFSASDAYFKKVVLKKTIESESTFIHRILPEINLNDYLLINTLQRKFAIYNNLKFTLPIAVRVHNTNFYWSNSIQTKQYRFSNVKLFIKEFYKFEFLQRKQFLQKVNYFFFPSESVIKHSIHEYPKVKSKAFLLPLNFQNAHPKISENRTKTIVIPGKVDPLRKDFSLLTAYVKMLHEKPMNFPIEIVFLGVTEGPKSKRFIEKLNQYSSSKLNIIHFKSSVPPDLYSKYLQSSDGILCPILINTTFQLSREVYGKTKVSGGVNDAINFGKWCFVPIGYTVDTSLNKQILTYDSVEDLYNLVYEKLSTISEVPLQAVDSPYQLANQQTFIQTIFK